MVLVLDLGSSVTRALLYDDAAQLAPGAISRAPLDFATAHDGRSEDDAGQAFERVAGVLDGLLGTGPAPISAVAISAYACSLVCLDSEGRPLSPVFTYADTRAADDARALRREVDELAALQRTGCRIRANYWPARIAWIKRTAPDVFHRTRWFASLGDYLCYRMFGVMRTGVSVASWTGLVNRGTANWDGEWLKSLGIAAHQLPPISQPGEAMTGLRKEWSARWPALRDAPWLPPLGDGAAANVGSGCVDANRIAVTIGSTAAMRVVGRAADSPHISPALWAYRVDHGRELIGGATTEGGNVFAWLRQSLRLQDEADLERELGSMPPDAHGLTVLPMFAGERSPGFADDARATLHGLSLDTSPAEIVRACMEGIAYRLAQVHDALKTVAGGQAKFVASGGALLASPTWRQIIADATGATVQLCAEPEATSRGAALLGLLQAGAIRGLGDLPARLGETHEPDAARGIVYRQAMARQQSLYARLAAAS